MSLNTTYMGLKLKNPVIVSSSKLTSTVESIKKCADCGAGAVVLKSLFEEQILLDIEATLKDNEMYFYYPEARDYITEISKDHGVNEYLKLIEEAKKAVKIPVIASINCVTANIWPDFASKIEKAGADAIELNISILPLCVVKTSKEIEDVYFNIVSEVKKHVKIPVAVKIGPGFTNLTSFTARLAEAGAKGIVIFNRFYHTDIDIEKLKLAPMNFYSSPQEMAEPLRWTALLSKRIKADIAASTGIHDYQALVKMLLAGASAVEMCSAFYKNGLEYIKVVLNGLEEWMKRHHFEHIDEFKGTMSTGKDNSAAFERIQFMKRTAGDI